MKKFLFVFIMTCFLMNAGFLQAGRGRRSSNSRVITLKITNTSGQKDVVWRLKSPNPNSKFGEMFLPSVSPYGSFVRIGLPASECSFDESNNPSVIVEAKIKTESTPFFTGKISGNSRGIHLMIKSNPGGGNPVLTGAGL